MLTQRRWAKGLEIEKLPALKPPTVSNECPVPPLPRTQLTGVQPSGSGSKAQAQPGASAFQGHSTFSFVLKVPLKLKAASLLAPSSITLGKRVSIYVFLKKARLPLLDCLFGNKI